MTHFRAYRNPDSPALADLWNRGLPDSALARPINGHEFDAQVVSKPTFESEGLIVAEREGKVVGFAHAGFGPDDPVGAVYQLNYDLGTIGMLVVEPGNDDPEVADGLMVAAETYLRERGAKVLYAGGQYPLNPFYWGLYGGSEWAGILSSHLGFLKAVQRAGYEPVSSTVLLEADLSSPEVRDPRSPLIKRQARVDIVEDVLPENWWQSLWIGDFRPTQYRLVAKADERELARATTWDMSWFGRRDGRAGIGLVAMEVGTSVRRKGYGRHLMVEILRHARSEMLSVVSLQTNSTNAPALALYQSVGFQPVETATLFRRPGAVDSPLLC